MRVVFTDYVANHTGTLLERIGGVQLKLTHGPQQAAVNRLQPIAQIGQRTRCDRAERIDQIAFFQRRIEGRVDDCVEGIGFKSVCIGCGHAQCLIIAMLNLSAWN